MNSGNVDIPHINSKETELQLFSYSEYSEISIINIPVFSLLVDLLL